MRTPIAARPLFFAIVTDVTRYADMRRFVSDMLIAEDGRHAAMPIIAMRATFDGHAFDAIRRHISLQYFYR